ncbi:Uncharacterised protein [Starkeya nomas]|uniref:HTH tetR-type domain-containing protein n=1 Tax=Starkeya nomas TaxID=2666134 RepID=A0A5S9NIU0_9HYPH|nr:TetR/AcrR family transcriptional regulator [Starkeya nomas]CAA0089968.1 Uncharacterised protein [Starkeya nomas]
MLDQSRHTSPEAKLLSAARRLFCNEGIHATGVARIIKEAGVARKTLYDRYGSKDNLLRAVFAAEADMWFHWFDHDIPSRGKEPLARILSLFDLLEHWFASSEFFGCVFINAVAEHEKRNGWIRDIAVAHRDSINARLRELAVAAGARDPDELTEKMGLVVDGAIVNAMVTGDPRIAAIAKAATGDILARALGFDARRNDCE